MQSSNKIIQSLWIGDTLSPMEQLSIKSFLSHGHDYHLYTYGPITNVPTGTTIKDASQILSADKIFIFQNGWGKGSYAVFADIFRYQLLHQRGGWWVDTDIVCIKPFEFAADYVIASSYEGKWGSPAINCVLKMPANNDLSRYLVNACNQVIDVQSLRFTELGPHLIQKAVRDLHLSEYVVSCYHFCPISWRSVKTKIAYQVPQPKWKQYLCGAKDFLRRLLKPWVKADRITTDTYAIHLWNNIWRSSQLDKHDQYHPSCLYEQIKAQYGLTKSADTDAIRVRATSPFILEKRFG